MIELTDQQTDKFDRIQEADYDDFPWTRDELEAIVWEPDRQKGWDDLAEADPPPTRP